jgi:hypothetical protein
MLQQLFLVNKLNDSKENFIIIFTLVAKKINSLFCQNISSRKDFIKA